MSVVSRLRWLWALSQADKLLLVEAAAALIRASLAIRLLPFRTVVEKAGAAPAAGEPDGATCAREIGRVTWAVDALARRLPWRIVCFQKGLAAHRLLNRRHVHSRLHYGVAQNVEDGVKAHVWVTHAGRPVIGVDEAAGYTCLVTFPAAADPVAH